MEQQASIFLQTPQAIIIELADISEDLKAQLLHRLDHIAKGCAALPSQAVDIVIRRQQHRFATLDHRAWQMNALYGCYVTNINGVATVFLLNDSKPFCQISFAQQITIELDQQLSQIKPLYDLIIFCIRYQLEQHQYFLLHGGVYIKNQRPLILLGQRGSRKTLIGLNLLKQGWDYLAEDKFVVNQQGIYQYDNYFTLNAYHFELLPWLLEQYPQARRFQRWSRVRKLMGKTAKSVLPQKLHPNVHRVFNKGLDCHIEQLFPHTNRAEKINTEVKVMLLSHQYQRQKIELCPLPREHLLDQLVQLQQLAFAQYNQLSSLVKLASQQMAFDLTEQLDNHFPQGKYCGLKFSSLQDPLVLAKIIDEWHCDES
jgi:hypothetical protein